MVKDVMVRIQEYYIPADFLVLDMQGDDEILILLGRLFLYTAKANIYIGSGASTYPLERYAVSLEHYVTVSKP